MVKAVLLLVSALKSSANGDLELTIPQLIKDFKENFKSRMVMLFVSTFLLSCESGFLNGNEFNQVIHYRTLQEWERHEKFLVERSFALRHNMDPALVKSKVDVYLQKATEEWKDFAGEIRSLISFFNKHYESTAVLAQSVDQLSRLLWMLHKCPDKIAFNFRYVLVDPQVRRRLQKFNRKLDKNHIRRIEADEVEQVYVLSYQNLGEFDCKQLYL